MAPGLSLLVPPRSPTKKTSQEQPDSTSSADAPAVRLYSPRRQANSVRRSKGTGLTSPEPALETDAHNTPFLSPYADEMDVDDKIVNAAETANTQQALQSPELLAQQPSQTLPQSRSSRSPVRTPELKTSLLQRQATNGHGRGQPAQQNQRGASQARDSSPGGHIPPFDWESFETRYEQALLEINSEEKELLEEFDRLVKVRTLLPTLILLLRLFRFSIANESSTSTSGHRLHLHTTTNAQ